MNYYRHKNGKKRKRSVVFLLVMVLILGVCAGCAGQGRYVKLKEKHEELKKEYSIEDGTSLADPLLTEPYPNEELSGQLKSEFKKITSYTPLVVRCFDVRYDHMLVVGAEEGYSDVIAVYDEAGKFLYGFKIEDPGTFRVMWNGDNVAYYSIRGHYLCTISEDGEILDLRRVVSTAENSVYNTKVLESRTRTVGTSTYYMSTGKRIDYSLSGSYKIITRTEADGTTTIVYDASDDQQLRNSKVLLYLLIVSPVLVFGCVKGIQKTIENIKLKRMKNSQS